MRTNGHLWTSGVNLYTAVRFPDPDFLLECNISAIWRRFPLIFAFICWMSAIFLLPVCLTYWPRKYTTRVDPQADNSHQVWSWYDHTLPSYSVFVCWYVTWLWPWPLTLNSCRTWRVTWPTLPPSLKTLCLSVLELRVITFPVGYHWKCIRGHCACAESRDPLVGGQKQLYFWNPRPRFAYSLYNFYWAPTTIRGCLIQVPSKWGPKWRFFGENGGPNLRYWFHDPQKALPCTEPRRLTYFASKSVRVSAVAFLKNQKSLCAEGREITHAQNRNP